MKVREDWRCTKVREGAKRLRKDLEVPRKYKNVKEDLRMFMKDHEG